MKVVIIHNELRVYWKRRLIYLKDRLSKNGIEFFAIEFFGLGSPYTFDRYEDNLIWWTCLFPEQSHTRTPKREIKKKLFNVLNAINPDIVISSSIVFSSGALGLRWARNHGKQFIMFDDAKPSQLNRSILVNYVKHLITSQSNALWLPSVEYYPEYSSVYGPEKMYYLYGYNCIDNEYFAGGTERHFQHHQVVCVARLVPIKNLRNLLKAWRFIEKNEPTHRLVIVGNGPLLNELKQYCMHLKMSTVTFAGDIINEKIVDYLLNSDGFILPSWSESWGLAVNEAMAAGLPVLLSKNVNSAATLLAEGSNGYLFDPGNCTDIQDKLLRFIKLTADEKRLMSNKSKEIISKLSYDHMGNELLKAIKYLSDGPTKRCNLLAIAAINLWSGHNSLQRWLFPDAGFRFGKTD